MQKALVILLAGAVTASGCAHRQARANPDAVYVQGMVIDGKGKDRARLAQDADECASIAQSTAPEERVAAGAVAGALVGALAGALIFRGSGLSGNRGATIGAGLGGLSGAGEGATHGGMDYRTVLRNCMIGRGHAPLN